MLNSRKTKIIATIGPATEGTAKIEGLIASGVNVLRLNLSHGSHEVHAKTVSSIRAISARLKCPVAILLDLQGPKIRVGRLKTPEITIKPDSLIVVTTDNAGADEGKITTTYQDLNRDVKPGDRILFDDGLIEARVREVRGHDVLCDVVYGGVLRQGKGINLPGVAVSAPSITEKDLRDIDFGVEHGVDYIALSFVRSPLDIIGLKKILAEKNADIAVIAKIEKAEAVEELSFILDEADGIMIARGDLGVELSPEQVPILQKRFITWASETGKLVITATQMLESMITNPRPTRAEASDVANAVFDGTDALMLSGETAVGKFPEKSVEIMSRIASEAEVEALSRKRLRRREKSVSSSFAEAVSYSAFAASIEVNAKAIVVFTQSGDSAKILSKLRPSAPIVAFTPVERTWRRLALLWGVKPYLIEFGGHTDEMICRGEAALLDNGLAKLGDPVVIVSGTKVGMRGATNMMKIDWIGSDECKVYLKEKK